MEKHVTFVKINSRRGFFIHFLQYMIQSYQKSQPQGVQINYLLTSLPTYQSIEQLIQITKSYVHWSSPQAFYFHFNTFSGLLANIIQCLQLGKDMKYQKLGASLLNIVEQKKLTLLQCHKSKFGYMYAHIQKRTELINTNITQKHLPKSLLLNFKQNTFFMGKTPQTVKANSKLIEESAKILNNACQENLNILKNLCCLGCKNQFREKEIIPSSQFFYHIIGYDNSKATLEEDLKAAFCAALNNGGGYILINKNSFNYIQGIQHLAKAKEDIYSLINLCYNSLKPNNHSFTFKLDWIKVVMNNSQDIYTSNQQQNLINQRYVLRIKLVPNFIRLFYIETKNNNKLKQNFYIKQNGKIKSVQNENIYELITQGYNSFTHKHTRKKYQCLICQTLMYNVKFQLKEQPKKQKQIQVQDPFKIKFKQSAILVVNHKKFQEQMIKNIRKTLDSNKKNYLLANPYQKYSSISNKAIWFINYQFQFEDLRRFMKIVDPQSNHKVIIATRFMKLNGKSLDCSFQKLSEEIKQKFKTEVKRQPTKPFKAGQLNSDIFCQYFSLRQSVFAYVYLDNQGVSIQAIRYMTSKQFHEALLNY